MEEGKTMVEGDNIMQIESPNSRLTITKMVLENFKSYAGVKEIGPFHKCFSSVVGPNGSGKSNVIDAMLFVFGKRAKKLRLNKVSELIHTSEVFKDNPLSFARVSVHFNDIIDTGEGDNDFMIIPNTEIIVTRIAYRNNSSSYKLNGKNCAFKDVATYVKSKGIDLDNNRFLILQGEVEMISMMPPKGKNENDEGLLEYLEDIIGSNKFLEETNEAAEKVENLTEQRQERLNRVKAVEAEKENLEGAKLEAEEFLKKERDIRKKKNILYQILVNKVSTDLERIIEENVCLNQKLNEELALHTKRQETASEFEKKYKQDKKEYKKAYEDLVDAKENFATNERHFIKLNEDIKHGNECIKKIEAKIKSAVKKSEDFSEKVLSAETKLPKLKEKLERLDETKKEEDIILEKMYDEVKVEVESIRPELEAKKKDLAPIQREKGIFKAALNTALTEVQLVEDNTSRAKQQLDSAEYELKNLDENQQKKKVKLECCEQERATSEKRIQEAKIEENQLVDKEKVLVNKCSELMSRVETSKAAMQSKSISPTVKRILKETKKGRDLANIGVLGRLGDLASTKEKYDVAISTSCTMLDYIVVETTLAAQKCLAYLRKKDLGRANFIPLDKMKKGVHNHSVETPEGAPRLFDMVSPSTYDVVPALYLAIGNTLVAPDLETATRWAYEYDKRWRVVTLDGNLIETSGTMSGGGRAVRKGGMRISNKKQILCESRSCFEDDYQKLEGQLKEAEFFLIKIRERKREIMDEVKHLEKKVKSLKVEAAKLTLEIESYDTTRVELTRQIPELREECKMSAAEKDKLRLLNNQVQKCRSDLKECETRASKLENEVALLQEKILSAGGMRLKNQEAKSEKLKKDMNTTNKQINEAHATLKSSSVALKKIEGLNLSAQKDLEENKKKLEKTTEERNKLEMDLKTIEQIFENAKEKEEEMKTKLQTLNEENEDIKKLLTKFKCIEMEIKSKLNDNEKMKKDFEEKIDHWEQEMNKLHDLEEHYGEYDLSDNEDDSDSTLGEIDVIPSKGSETVESKSNGILPTLSKDVLLKYNVEEIKKDIDVMEREKDAIARNANMGAIDEYRKKEADYLNRVGELDAITEQRTAARKVHEDLRTKRLEMFMEGFNMITLKLKEMYQMITQGGDAELELVDSLDPFSEGIVFSVRPPKKSWKNIANLSGGEKTLSSLALVFALHHFKPSPLYVMDEIDAALDFKNVSIVATYIKERTKNAQFIIISLRNNMFELADRLVGIYKTNNCTKSITIDPRQFGKTKQQEDDIKLPLIDRTNLSHAQEVLT